MEENRWWDEVLAELGVGRDLLSDEDRHRLREDGYAIWPAVIEQPWRRALAGRIDELFEEEGGQAGHEFRQEAGAHRLANLVDKGPVFDGTWQHPRVLAAAEWVLGRPFKLTSVNARDVPAGSGNQDLHADWGADNDGRSQIVNSLWMLDDCGPDNGATRLVPGSHRYGITPQEAARAGWTSPAEVTLDVPAGTIVVFDGHLWHGGTANRTGRRRRMLHVAFVAREHPQQLNQRAHVHDQTIRRLSPAARLLLDLAGSPAARTLANSGTAVNRDRHEARR